MMTRYIRNFDNVPVGTIVADAKDGQIYVGWAWTSDKDHPCKKTGVAIAEGRMNLPEVVIKSLLECERDGFLQKRPDDILYYGMSGATVAQIMANEIFRFVSYAHKTLLIEL